MTQPSDSEPLTLPFQSAPKTQRFDPDEVLDFIRDYEDEGGLIALPRLLFEYLTALSEKMGMLLRIDTLAANLPLFLNDDQRRWLTSIAEAANLLDDNAIAQGISQ